jgi:hypothetical protein
MSTRYKRISQKEFYGVCCAINEIADEDNHIPSTREELASRLSSELFLTLSRSTITQALDITGTSYLSSGDKTARDKDVLGHHDSRLRFLECQFNKLARHCNFEVRRPDGPKPVAEGES